MATIHSLPVLVGVYKIYPMATSSFGAWKISILDSAGLSNVATNPCVLRLDNEKGLRLNLPQRLPTVRLNRVICFKIEIYDLNENKWVETDILVLSSAPTIRIQNCNSSGLLSDWSCRAGQEGQRSTQLPGLWYEQ